MEIRKMYLFHSLLMYDSETKNIINFIINESKINSANSNCNQSRWGRRNPSVVFCMGHLNYDQRLHYRALHCIHIHHIIIYIHNHKNMHILSYLKFRSLQMHHSCNLDLKISKIHKKRFLHWIGDVRLMHLRYV